MLMNRDCSVGRPLLNFLRQFLKCEAGAMQAVEYLLMGTIVALGILVGLVSYRDAIATEYGDIAAALKNLNQSFSFTLSGGGTSSYGDSVGATNTISVSAPAPTSE
jgi:Flp pilus assembly pilin Flp